MATVFSEEDLPKRRSEVRVEDRVDDRVEEAVEVAEPDGDAHQRRRVVTAGAAEGPNERDAEERQPAADERAGDDRQRPCRLALPSLTLLLHLAFGRRRRAAAAGFHRRRRCGRVPRSRLPVAVVQTDEVQPAAARRRRR